MEGLDVLRITPRACALFGMLVLLVVLKIVGAA